MDLVSEEQQHADMVVVAKVRILADQLQDAINGARESGVALRVFSNGEAQSSYSINIEAHRVVSYKPPGT